MRCGSCAIPFKKIVDLEIHWKTTGCMQYRHVWERFMEARRRGSSGRRILHEAFPDLWPSEPMDEETKEKLREIQERRKKEGIKFPRKEKR